MGPNSPSQYLNTRDGRSIFFSVPSRKDQPGSDLSCNKQTNSFTSELILCLLSIFKMLFFHKLRKEGWLCFPIPVLSEEGPAAEKQESSDLTPALSEESVMVVNCWDSCISAENDLAG